MSTDSCLLTIPQVARQLGVNPERVRALIAGGRLRAIDLNPRPGRRRYRHLKVRREALDDFLAAAEATTAPAPRTERQRPRCAEAPAGWKDRY